MSSEDTDAPSGISEEIDGMQESAKSFIETKKYAKAINVLSDAMMRAKTTEEKSATLCARSLAYNGMSKWLRGIPAKDSESRAIMAEDPISLAELGLNDATKSVALNPLNPDAYLQQGAAYILLEDYVKAKEQVMAGLSVVPFHEGLHKALQEVQGHLAGSRSASPAPQLPSSSSPSTKRKARSVDDAECSLCMKLFFEPVTTPCGHTFCRPCFHRARDHHNKCPMCRTLLPVNKEIPVTAALSQLLQTSFPEEYEARRQEQLHLNSAADGREAPLSIFVMSNILPGEEMSLNIFEPRYRLLIRRCLEGSRKFGMTTVNRAHELSNIACEVEIQECRAAPDGRFLIDIVGTQRFRVARSWEQDGYRVAEPEFFHDEWPETDSQEMKDLRAALDEAVASVDKMRQKLSSHGGHIPENPAFMRNMGEALTPEAAEKVSFWVGSLIQSFSRYTDRLPLLELTNTAERLTRMSGILDNVVESLDEGNIRGCRIV